VFEQCILNTKNIINEFLQLLQAILNNYLFNKHYLFFNIFSRNDESVFLQLKPFQINRIRVLSLHASCAIKTKNAILISRGDS